MRLLWVVIIVGWGAVASAQQATQPNTPGTMQLSVFQWQMQVLNEDGESMSNRLYQGNSYDATTLNQYLMGSPRMDYRVRPYTGPDIGPYDFRVQSIGAGIPGIPGVPRQ